MPFGNLKAADVMPTVEGGDEAGGRGYLPSQTRCSAPLKVAGKQIKRLIRKLNRNTNTANVRSLQAINTRVWRKKNPPRLLVAMHIGISHQNGQFSNA